MDKDLKKYQAFLTVSLTDDFEILQREKNWPARIQGGSWSFDTSRGIRRGGRSSQLRASTFEII
jgi:hypothetical protein